MSRTNRKSLPDKISKKNKNASTRSPKKVIKAPPQSSSTPAGRITPRKKLNTFNETQRRKKTMDLERTNQLYAGRIENLTEVPKNLTQCFPAEYFRDSLMRSKPGKIALREIRYFQRSTHHLIPRLSFCRLVREILQRQSDLGMRIQSNALSALQEASESYIVRVFEEMQLLAVHSRRITIQPKDLHILNMIKYNN